MIVESVDRAGARLAVFPQADLQRFSFRLNRPGDAMFRLPSVRLAELVTDGAIVVEGAVPGRTIRSVLDPDRGHEIRIVDQGQVRWAGPLLTVDESARDVTFGAEGLMWYLRKMFLLDTVQTVAYPDPLAPAVTVSRDQHELLAALVELGQLKAGGDRRIFTDQVSPSGVLRDRQYKGWELPNIYDLVINLTNLTSMQGGPDIDIDPATRRLRAWTPRRGRRRRNLVFNDRNVRGWRRQVDKTAQANAVLGVGAGEGQDMLRVDRTSATSIARVGRLEEVYANKDVSRSATLTEQVDADLSERATLRSTFTVKVATDDPPLWSYEVGDECRIHFGSPYEPVDEWRRIIGIDVLPGGRDGGETLAELTLERLGVS